MKNSIESVDLGAVKSFYILQVFLLFFCCFFSVVYMCVCVCVSLDTLSCSLSVTLYILYAFSDSEMYSIICHMSFSCSFLVYSIVSSGFMYIKNKKKKKKNLQCTSGFNPTYIIYLSLSSILLYGNCKIVEHEHNPLYCFITLVINHILLTIKAISPKASLASAKSDSSTIFC